jgi:NitT/TauT family transport system permease protein
MNTASITPTTAAGDDVAAVATRTVRKKKAAVWGGRLALLAVIIGGWQLFTTVQLNGSKTPIVDPFFYGQPSGIAQRLVDFFRNGTEFGSYWLQIETTLKEAVFGFGIGAAAGVVVGIALGQSTFLADVLGPFIKVFNAIPRIVLGSIFIVALGIGTEPKVLLAAVLVFFIVFFNAFQGVREVDPNIIANARVLGASRLQIVRHVTVPSALSWIIASLHTAFGFAIVGALVAEVLGAQAGLGLVIKTSQGNFDPDGVFAVMVTVAVITLVAEWILTGVERRLLSWRPPSPSDSAVI